MILAAGRGERLRPITDTTPKPLLKIGNTTLIEHHLSKLKENGIEHIIINVAYLAEKIVEYLGDGSRYGLKISYSWERNGALGTGGGIIQAKQLFNEETFLIINGDIYTDYDFSKVQIPATSIAHLVLVPNPPHNPQGDYQLSNGKLQRSGKTGTTYTFSGIGIYRKSLFELLTPEKIQLAAILENEIKNENISGELFGSIWHDVGTTERLILTRSIAEAT